MKKGAALIRAAPLEFSWLMAMADGATPLAVCHAP
jgi:hypothetical protein